VARALLAQFQPGDRIAVWAPNSAEWIILQQGISLAGMVLVALNPAYRAREMQFTLTQSGAAGLFCVDEYRGFDMRELASQLQPGLPVLRAVVSLNEWDAFLARGNDTTPLPEVKPHDMIQVQYTSGTTGFPRGAMLHHMGLVNEAAFVAERAGMSDGGVYINAMPMYHIGGGAVTSFGAWAKRGTFVILPGFSPATILEAFETYRGTHTLVVPTMLIAMLDHPDLLTRDLSSLQTILSGASSVPASLVRKTIATLDCQFSILFGQTEAHGVVSQTRVTDSPEDQANTVGQPLPQLEMKIAGVKDMIIRGGMNLYPAEIEAALQDHPAIETAAVIGIPDDRWGEQVGAVLRIRPRPRPPSHCRPDRVPPRPARPAQVPGLLVVHRRDADDPERQDPEVRPQGPGRPGRPAVRPGPADRPGPVLTSGWIVLRVDAVLTEQGAEPLDLVGEMSALLGHLQANLHFRPGLFSGLRQQLDDLLAQLVQFGAQPDQHLRGHAVTLTDQAQQDVLGADVALAELQRLTQRELQYLLGPGRERDVPGRRLLAPADDLLDLLPHGIQADLQRLQRPGRDTFALVDEAEQEVLGTDVVVIKRPGFFLSQDHHPPGPVGKPLEHRLPPRATEQSIHTTLPQKSGATVEPHAARQDSNLRYRFRTPMTGPSSTIAEGLPSHSGHECPGPVCGTVCGT
jgi:fatty-acyl-CoA synthase